MHLIYTTRTTGFEKGQHYRNPRFFAGVDKAAKSITIEGDFPAIMAAYEKADIKVEVIGAETGEQTDGRGLDPAGDERAELAAQYEERFGEKPHHAMKADTIRQKLGEAGEKPQE